jgi:peptide/nickel transport system ATP-binding protein
VSTDEMAQSTPESESNGAPGVGTRPGGAAAVSTTGDPLLRVAGLTKHFPMFRQTLIKRPANPVRAVDGISFELRRGQTLGLVGESGCGKSTAGRTILRLLEPTGGTIQFEGRDITHVGGDELRVLRREMQMIFQDPYGSLNPRQTIGSIVAAPFEIQKIDPPGGVRKAVQELMARVGLNPEHYNRFPHEFSGGQRQRIGVARAIALQPKLIVCDEPVSALDVSIQAQVVNLLEDIQAEQQMAYVFIAHDLSVVRHIADRVAVMYLGKIMEMADRDEFYEAPRHPYTKALLSAVPVPDPGHRERRGRIMLQGDLPSPANPPSGCVFRTRCWKAQDRCATEVPPLVDLSPGHAVACHFPEPVPAVPIFERPAAV